MPLTLAQRGLWIVHELDPGDTSYHTILALRLTGEVDAAAMVSALRGVLQRHEVLRTTLPVGPDGEPHQVVHAADTVPVEHHDVRREPDPPAAADALLGRYQAEPYDLAVSPPTRCAVLTVSATETVVLLAAHHLVNDSVSNAILVRDLDQLYARARGAEPADLPALPVQYADVALWQQERVAAGALDAARAHWARHLDGVDGGVDPVLLGPRDGWGPDADVVVELSASRTEALRDLTATVHATPFMALFAAWSLVLAGLDPAAGGDVVVGVPVDGRSHRALQDLVGLFVTMVPVRLRVDAGHSFRALLGAARDALLEAYGAADVPLEWIVRDLAPPRLPGRPPLVEVSCQLQHVTGGALVVGGHPAEPVTPAPQAAKFQLSLNALISETGTALHLAYPRDRFARDAVEALARQLHAVLDRVAVDPDVLLRDLPAFDPPAFDPPAAGQTVAPARPAAPVLPRQGHGPAAVEPAAVAALFAEVLGNDVAVTDAFFDVGGHSLLALTVMRRLRDRHGADIPMNLLFSHPTAQRLAAAVSGWATQDDPRGETHAADPVADVGCWLPPLPAAAADPPAHVLVTGATGLLGVQVCAELLETTPITVWALVRGASAAAARRHLLGALRDSGRYRPDWADRILVLAGDLARSRLGLTDAAYDEAAATVDAVLHAGASTNLLDGYARLRGPNVVGTREVLRFATTGRLKQVHHVSTISIVRCGADGPEILAENWRTDPRHLDPGGYAASKWVAEETVRQAAGLGVPAAVYRPGRISGAAGTGPPPAADAFWSVVLACLDAGVAPTGAGWEDFGDRLLPADQAARAYVHLAFATPADGRCHTLTNPVRTTLSEVLDVARRLGWPVDTVPVEEWIRQLEVAAADPRSRSDALEAALLLVGEAGRAAPGVSRPVDAAKTDARLADAGLAFPPVDGPLIERYLRGLAERGVLAPPSIAGAPRRAEADLDADPGAAPGFWQMWERAVAGHPSRPAAADADETVTVAELDRRAGEIAAALAARGVGPGDRVGIRLPHEVALLATVLAVVRSGAAFVPVDHRFDDDRSRGILRRAGVRITVSRDGTGTDVVSPEELAREGEGLPVPPARPGPVAYLLFTSGSTGVPKGVVVPHSGLAVYLAWVRSAYVGRRPRGAALYSSVAFDLTMTSLFGPLVSGGPVRLVAPAGGILAVAALLREGVGFDFLKLTPTHLRMLVDELAGRSVRGHVGVLVVGGEALPPDLVAAWRVIGPHTAVVNEYGPTEATVGCCVHRIEPGDPVPAPVPIGRPIPGVRPGVRGPSGAAVPADTVGELVIGGATLAWGYEQRPAETARRFEPDPDLPGARRYRTGDQVRLRAADGVYVYHGRDDDQVKIRGHRVELDEIATTLRGLPGVGDCVVRPDGDALIAYVVPEHPGAGVPAGLRAAARRLLPEYLLPGTVVAIDAVPMTVNGKIDTARLPAPARS